MEKALKLRKSGPKFMIKDIENVLQDLYDQFNVINLRNEYLEKELARVKSETFKDEELAKMKRKYDDMSKECNMGFPISDEEDKAIGDWIKMITKDDDPFIKSSGTIGGRFTYEFTPTGIGVIGRIIDSFSKKDFVFRQL